MDRNTLLAFALSMGVFTLWLVWQGENQPPPGESPVPFAAQLEDDAGRRETGGAEGAAGDASASSRPTPEPTPAVTPSEPAAASGKQVAPWQGSFENEFFTARLTNRGAGLVAWSLAKYQDKNPRNGDGGSPIELVNLDSANTVALRTPFAELGLGDLGDARYEVVEQSDNAVTFAYSQDGITIRKSYEFDPERYLLDLSITVVNETDRVLAPGFEIVWPAALVEGNDFREESLVALTSEGVERSPVASVGVPGFFDKLLGGGGPDDLRFGDVSWAGVDLKYFLAVLLLEKPRLTTARFEPLEPGKIAASIVSFEPLDVAPGGSATRRVTGFLGPKKPELLDTIGHELEKSINLGWSWVEPLTHFFQWLLTAFYAVIPNYGLVIILITILVRVATLPIMNRQMRSMEKMRALQPRMKELQEKYADDRAKQSEAMMALYKETGVNPLAGCLPMLLQLPVFIGLFYALQSSFDLRQAPFVGWIDDLSAPEVLFTLPGLDFPVRILPLVMGGSMFLQQKLTPMTTTDPSQQMMMTIMMPIMMTVLFYQFPSGLVLYWMVSNFLGIAHQLFIGRRMRKQE